MFFGFCFVRNLLSDKLFLWKIRFFFGRKVDYFLLANMILFSVEYLFCFLLDFWFLTDLNCALIQTSVSKKKFLIGGKLDSFLVVNLIFGRHLFFFLWQHYFLLCGKRDSRSMENLIFFSVKLEFCCVINMNLEACSMANFILCLKFDFCSDENLILIPFLGKFDFFFQWQIWFLINGKLDFFLMPNLIFTL